MDNIQKKTMKKNQNYRSTYRTKKMEGGMPGKSNPIFNENITKTALEFYKILKSDNITKSLIKSKKDFEVILNTMNIPSFKGLKKDKNLKKLLETVILDPDIFDGQEYYRSKGEYGNKTPDYTAEIKVGDFFYSINNDEENSKIINIVNMTTGKEGTAPARMFDGQKPIPFDDISIDELKRFKEWYYILPDELMNIFQQNSGNNKVGEILQILGQDVNQRFSIDELKVKQYSLKSKIQLIEDPALKQWCESDQNLYVCKDFMKISRDNTLETYQPLSLYTQTSPLYVKIFTLFCDGLSVEPESDPNNRPNSSAQNETSQGFAVGLEPIPSPKPKVIEAVELPHSQFEERRNSNLGNPFFNYAINSDNSDNFTVLENEMGGGSTPGGSLGDYESAFVVPNEDNTLICSFIEKMIDIGVNMEMFYGNLQDKKYLYSQKLFECLLNVNDTTINTKKYFDFVISFKDFIKLNDEPLYEDLDKKGKKRPAPAATPAASMEKWSVADVLGFMRSNHLSAASRRIVADNDVDGSSLSEMTLEELVELGMPENEAGRLLALRHKVSTFSHPDNLDTTDKLDTGNLDFSDFKDFLKRAIKNNNFIVFLVLINSIQKLDDPNKKQQIINNLKNETVEYENNKKKLLDAIKTILEKLKSKNECKSTQGKNLGFCGEYYQNLNKKKLIKILENSFFTGFASRLLGDFEDFISSSGEVSGEEQINSPHIIKEVTPEVSTIEQAIEIIKKYLLTKDDLSKQELAQRLLAMGLFNTVNLSSVPTLPLRQTNSQKGEGGSRNMKKRTHKNRFNSSKKSKLKRKKKN